VTRARIEVWLASREPSRPAALAAQMTRQIIECADDDINAAATMAEAMGTLGLCAVARVNEERTTSSDLALELLAADAFVTYAFEAAAEEGVDVMPLALRLLRAA
jgi:hypothetical protein